MDEVAKLGVKIGKQWGIDLQQFGDGVAEEFGQAVPYAGPSGTKRRRGHQEQAGIFLTQLLAAPCEQFANDDAAQTVGDEHDALAGEDGRVSLDRDG